MTKEEKRARRNRLNRVQRYKAKEEAIEMMGGKCSDCGGVFHSSSYDFHHTDPREKDVDPGSLLRGSRETLEKELAKCVLLCANCHRKLHWELANHDTDWDESPEEKLTLTVDGVTKTIMEWAEESGIFYETLRTRVREYGWDHKKAVTTPLRKRGTNKPNTITALGKTQPITQWAAETALPVNTIRSRLRMGWCPDRAMTTPRRRRRDGS